MKGVTVNVTDTYASEIFGRKTKYFEIWKNLLCFLNVMYYYVHVSEIHVRIECICLMSVHWINNSHIFSKAKFLQMRSNFGSFPNPTGAHIHAQEVVAYMQGIWFYCLLYSMCVLSDWLRSLDQSHALETNLNLPRKLRLCCVVQV